MLSKLLVLMVACCGLPVSVWAQQESCEQMASMARMATASSSAALIAERQKASVARTCSVGPRFFPDIDVLPEGEKKPRTYRTGPRYTSLWWSVGHCFRTT